MDMRLSATARERAIAAFLARPTVVVLHAGVQHYDWGDRKFIPGLLGRANPEGEPHAELWMGAHDDLPSSVQLDGSQVPLNELIARHAEVVLGPAAAKRFDHRLPYLLKVLSAATPLSIQVHPDEHKAREGFERENQAGVPLGADSRCYRDANHKPELIAALTDFYALRGFRPLDEVAALAGCTPELAELMSGFRPTAGHLKDLYERIMTAPQDRVDAILAPLVQRLRAADDHRPYHRGERGYWVLLADRQFTRHGRYDRGLLCVYLLNLVNLCPGEAMYLPAGVPHAYLQGAGMEIMASSNNVLRGGLTHKHVDVAELLRNVVFEGRKPRILQPEPGNGAHEWVYAAPVEEFELRRIALDETVSYHARPDHGAEILILVQLDAEQPVRVESPGELVQVTKGRSFLAPYAVPYSLHADGKAVLYKAAVPR